MWKTVKLDDIADVKAGNPAPQDKNLFENGVYPFVRTSDVGKVKVGSLSDANDKLNQQGIAKLKLFPKGTILFPKSGASTFLNHRVILEMDAYVASHLATIKSKQDDVSDKYLWYFLQTIDAADLVADSSYPSLNTKTIQSISVPLPPLAEQERIVAKLDAAFAEIDKAINLIEVNVTNANAIYEQKLLNVFELPDSSWIKSSLAELTHQITDGKHGDCNNELNSGYYFLSAKDVRDGTLNYNGAREITIEDFNETHRRTKLESGDILITNSGTIGRMAIAPKHERTSKTTFQKSVAIIKPINDLVDKNYLYFSLKSKVVLLQKISQGAAQKNLLLRDLRALEISYPTTISEQKNLAKELGIIEKQCSTLSRVLEKKLKQLAMLKSAILSQELQSSEAA